MTSLAPNLFDRRFGDLVRLGRSKLPALAPDWTDHNAHDPGITFIELLAWVAETQLYSLARMRRGERAAYAALFGVTPVGTRPARGLLWPDPSDPESPATTFKSSRVIPDDAVIHVVGGDKPEYRPTHRVLWVPGRIVRLQAARAHGQVRDFTAINERGSPEFAPFGVSAGPRDVLRMEYECNDEQGLFPIDREDAEDAYFVIGVRTPSVADLERAATSNQRAFDEVPLSVTLESERGRFALSVVEDTSHGLMQTGALVLDVSAVRGSPQHFAIELRAPGGFPRPPRALRIEPNVLPIVQGHRVPAEMAEANGQPDFSFDLAVPGLQFRAGLEPVQVYVDDESGPGPWRRCDRLADQGPRDPVFELDAARGRIIFGNGINGRVPSRSARIIVAYDVCDGADGATARNRRWTVSGFPGGFGVNPDPVSGGAGASTFVEQRREARRRMREARPIVSGADLVNAALALPLLEVARAWVAPLDRRSPQTNVVTLVAMRARSPASDSQDVPETRRWLEAIRRRLSARMTLGTRLIVVAPRYVGFHVVARVRSALGRNPELVKRAIADALRDRTALVGRGPIKAREPGVSISQREVVAWIRSVDGVDRVDELRIVLANGRSDESVKVPPGGLPRLDSAQTTIDVRASGPGSAS